MKREGKAFDIFLVTGFIFFGFLVVFPFWYMIVLSFNQGSDALRGGIYFWPRVFTFENYEVIFKDRSIVRAFFMTVSRTFLGAIIANVVCGLTGFALTKRDINFQVGYLVILLVPMYVVGGLIPTFFVYRFLGIYDTFWVFILPNLAWGYTIILMRTFFRSIPAEIEESAFMDGAGYLRIYFKLIFPLSMPIIATIFLFDAVWHWNSWMDVVFFTRKDSLNTLMSLLVRLLRETSASIENIKSLRRVPRMTPKVLKAAMTVVTVTPIVMVYPFLQKYFVKGIMIGSIKG